MKIKHRVGRKCSSLIYAIGLVWTLKTTSMKVAIIKHGVSHHSHCPRGRWLKAHQNQNTCNLFHQFRHLAASTVSLNLGLIFRFTNHKESITCSNIEFMKQKPNPLNSQRFCPYVWKVPQSGNLDQLDHPFSNCILNPQYLSWQVLYLSCPLSHCPVPSRWRVSK